MAQLIGICGAMSAGKSTVAAHLAETANGKRLRLADGLKRMLRSVGLTDEQVDGGEKSEPIDLLCGHTPRYAMQMLGTEWGRKLIGPDFWVKVCTLSITDEVVKGDAEVIIVDDIRHKNEADMIRRLGGQVWLVRRPEVEKPFGIFKRAMWHLFRRVPGQHSSEIEWRFLKVDQVLMNTGDVDALKESAIQLLHFARGNDGPEPTR